MSRSFKCFHIAFEGLIFDRTADRETDRTLSDETCQNLPNNATEAFPEQTETADKSQRMVFNKCLYRVCLVKRLYRLFKRL